jgi:hypothetical protein
VTADHERSVTVPAYDPKPDLALVQAAAEGREPSEIGSDQKVRTAIEKLAGNGDSKRGRRLLARLVLAVRERHSGPSWPCGSETISANLT